MARACVAASTQYLEIDAAIVSVPFTVAVWFRSDSDAVAQMLFSLATIGSDLNSIVMSARGDVGGDIIRATVNDGTGSSVDTTAGYTANAWQHACLVCAATNDRRIFLNGGNKGTTTVSKTPSGMNRTSVGRYGGLAGGSYLSGRIAEMGLWSAALDDAEVNGLAQALCPKLIRPQSLASYFPLFGNDATELDRWKNGSHLTVTGATKGEHPRIYYPAYTLSPSLTGSLIEGVTRDNAGNPLGGCTVKRFRTADDVLLASTTSDGSGNYLLSGSPEPSYLVAYKAGSPDVAGVTVNTIVGS